jgi:hypothetical protein
MAKPFDAIHIGDGVYVSYDGWQLKVMANSHDRPTDTIYFEPEVVANFLKLIERLKAE